MKRHRYDVQAFTGYGKHAVVGAASTLYQTHIQTTALSLRACECLTIRHRHLIDVAYRVECV